jgi:glycosyltransferase involved in cell wall biosynthesis
MAINFKEYWEPILKDLPSNCLIWGERSDVDKFYQSADLMVFTSKKETSPLVIREALSWKLPCLIYNLPAYKNMYDKFSGVGYLKDGDFKENIKKIKSL